MRTETLSSMESDPGPTDSLKQKAAALNALISGPIASSAENLAARSRGIPYERDFHFYNNFDEFKSPAREIARKSESTLQDIASSGDLWGRRKPPLPPTDLDEAFDWIVNLNDEFLERFNVSMDEFKIQREKAEESGGRISAAELEGGFQLVYGKKKRDFARNSEKYEGNTLQSMEVGVKVASKDSKTTAPRSKVPFHIPTIRRPQDEFHIVVNNSDRPFQHVCLERSEDGSRFIHPLEKLSMVDFVDRDIGEGDPVNPIPLVDTPFKLVEDINELKELAAKLQEVNEFAVDLEHNQYRSFQGLTCLMQISTRTEDFIVDTLKLRIHIGSYLREAFKDPAKRKVMHGADRDILWLQRDFGIYVCNLFDTGQASRVLQLERKSLEYLLQHFCGFNANKEYQNADWRLRPLPEEMLKYGREDTHYLLHIYDLMKIRLLATSSNENDLLLEVYRRSYEICMQLYEKDLLTDTTYLHIYGLQEADFSSMQLSIVSGLCEWRDKVAREEDESTGYILPNKTLLEIARKMPLSAGKLNRLVKSKHPYVERNLSTVIHTIRRSVENSSSFESISKQLMKDHLELLKSSQNIGGADNSKLLPAEDPIECTVVQKDVFDGSSTEHATTSMVSLDENAKPTSAETFSSQIALVIKPQQKENLEVLSYATVSLTQEKIDTRFTESMVSAKKSSITSVQLSTKQSSAFGALLGSTSSKRKVNHDNGVSPLQDKNATIVEQIKSSVALPFHTFSGDKNTLQTSSEIAVLKNPQPDPPKQSLDQQAEISTVLDEVIPLEYGSDGSDSPSEVPKVDNDLKHEEEDPTSLSDLSSGFQKCFQSINERWGLSKQEQRPHHEEETINIQLKPFDYAAARQSTRLGEPLKEVEGAPSDSREKRKGGSASGRAAREERSSGFQQPRRRQAFPPTGNRSVTYR